MITLPLPSGDVQPIVFERALIFRELVAIRRIEHQNAALLDIRLVPADLRSGEGHIAGQHDRRIAIENRLRSVLQQEIKAVSIGAVGKSTGFVAPAFHRPGTRQIMSIKLCDIMSPLL